MTPSPLLGPIVALVAWSLLVLFYMGFVRFRAVKQAKLPIDPSRGGRGQDLEGVLEPRCNWPAHNYAHLMEQPTLFYAIALTLALMDFGGGINAWLAWGYVILRVVHSLVQGTVNMLILRTPLFGLSSLCLIGLVTHAALRIAHDAGLI